MRAHTYALALTIRITNLSYGRGIYPGVDHLAISSSQGHF